MDVVNNIRIVLAYPNDVSAEKEAVETVAKEIDRNTRQRGFRLLLDTWVVIVPAGIHENGPQGHIDTRLQPADCDLFIAVLHKRIGTPLESGQTALEHEISLAIESWQQKKKPQVMLHFKSVDPADLRVDDREQYQRLDAFKRKYEKIGLYREFADISDLKDQLRSGIWSYVLSLFRKDETTEAVRYVVLWEVSSETVPVRVEGLSERLGDINLVLRLKEEPSEGVRIFIDVTLYVNTNVTNRLFVDYLTDAVLMVGTGDLRASPLVVCGRFLPAGPSVGSVGNALRFEGIPVVFDGTTKGRMVISNVRVNAFQRGLGSRGDRDNQIVGYLHIEASRQAGLEFSNPSPQLTLAAPWEPSLFEVVGPGGRKSETFAFVDEEGVNAQFAVEPARYSAQVCTFIRFLERFPGAFRTKDEEAGRGAVSVGGDLLQWQVSWTAAADCGTRFLARFHNVPQGVRILVTDQDVVPDGLGRVGREAKAVLVATDADGAGESSVSAGAVPGASVGQQSVQ